MSVSRYTGAKPAALPDIQVVGRKPWKPKYMPSTIMIERVARAIAASHGSTDWKTYARSARAAVAAMREPTVDMLEAALPNCPDWGYLPEEWQAMIDHVVNETIN